MMTDPVADMLARIRNANKALHESTEMRTSRLKEGIARILKEEGYITDFHVKKGESFDTLVVQLKYGRSRERIITDLKRVSKPGRRVYAGKDRLPRVLGGMGVAILSTSTGLITSRTAEEQGVGSRGAMQGADLRLDVGYSHPVVIKAPQGITFELPTQTEIVVKGVDKQQVGQISAEIRKVRPPEPYKGKGIRYQGEYVRRKVGKRA